MIQETAGRMFRSAEFFMKSMMPLVCFFDARAGKTGLKYDREAWNDVLAVPGFSFADSGVTRGSKMRYFGKRINLMREE